MLMGSFLSDNSTLDGVGNNNCSSATTEEVSGWVVVLVEHVQPAMCIFGIVGNFLNLTVLTRKKLSSSTILRHCANLCLISLAVSDLLFCCFVFLCVFIPTNMIFTETGGFFYYYTRFSYALINTFIMESTLLIVVMSLERYLAICCPFRPDLYLDRQRVKNIIKISYAFSIVFNIPVWFRFEPVTVCAGNTSIFVPTDDNFTCPCQAALAVNSTRIPPPSSPETPLFLYGYRQVNLCGSEIVETTYRVLWAAVGNYIPLVLLAYCNISLCRNIYLSYKNRMVLGRQDQSQKKAKSNTILNVTLVAIVVLFFLLVAPSETAIHIMDITKTNDKTSLEAVLNLMQTVNFSINFFLYCIFDPDFRKVFKHVACCGYYNFYSVSQDWNKDFETTLM